jgi:hypothetical protein
LTKDDDSHGNRDLRRGDKILDSYIGLQAKAKLAKSDSGCREGDRILGSKLTAEVIAPLPTP